MSPDPTVEPQNLIRCCNEALILASLSRGAKHGYELARDLARDGDGYFQFQHGTLYPILHKLEKKGLIKGTWATGTGGRKRKSYRLTRAGRGYAARQVASWQHFVERFLGAVGVTG